MRLDDARLCLDCEEIHEEQECPSCGSEAFAFLTRWIQSTTRDEDRRAGTRPSQPAPLPSSRPTPSPDELEAWRRIVEHSPEEPAGRGRGRAIVTRSLWGLAAAGVAGWVWTRRGSGSGGSGTT